MSKTIVTRIINAPIDNVFKTISEVSEFSKAAPDVIKVEFVSDTRSGKGTVFRETRSIKGKESTVELEITEYVQNERVRYVADSHGTIWDSIYTVADENGATLLTLTMDARAHKLAAKLMNPMVRTMVQKALEADMDSVKAYCERPVVGAES